MGRMLINATQPEELRVALIRDDILADLDIEGAGGNKKKGNIYKGSVTRVEPSLEAAFVEFGSGRQGFLSLKEISEVYYTKPLSEFPDEKRPNIKDLIREGQEFMVQVEKDERGTKGAALSTFITLAGCYLVLMPNNPQSGGISRRIEGDEREELRTTLAQLTMPEGMGVIVRTAGVGKSIEDLQWDLDILLHQWNSIVQASNTQSAPFLIHQEGDVVIRSIRDNLRKDITEIIIDNQEVYVKAKNYIEQVKPEFLSILKLYQDSIPLFTRFQIEEQIELAYQREVLLPSGGSIVIDRTEALVSIDINSARSTSGADIESTAFHTNLEAAEEIARQLRLRDLGGLIVIDFIDMSSVQHQREVENRLREALRIDRARVQVGRISRFGLLEMSRQRLHLALGEVTQTVCKHCEGRGVLRSVESLALSVVRLLEEYALKPNTTEVQAQLPVALATFILNEKRDVISTIERRHQIDIVIIPNPYLEDNNYKIEQIKEDRATRAKQRSYALVEKPEVEIVRASEIEIGSDKPALQHVVNAPRRAKDEQSGLIKRIWNSLFGSLSTSTAAKPKHDRSSQRRGGHSGNRRRGQSGNRGPRPAAATSAVDSVTAANASTPSSQPRQNNRSRNRSRSSQNPNSRKRTSTASAPTANTTSES